MLIAAAAAGIAMLAAPVAADRNEEFRRCLSWDSSTNTISGGHDWYNSDSCRKWAEESLGVTFFAIFMVFALIIVPFIFYCARCFCQCCGGTHRTTGCCCSDTSSRGNFPGYTNRVITCSRTAFLLSFAGTIALSVLIFTTNSKVHTDLLATVDSVDTVVQQAKDIAVKSNEYATALNAYNPPLVGPNFASEAAAVSGRMDSRLDEVHKVLNHIRDAESNSGWGRVHWAYSVPAYSMFVLLIATIPMCCSWRRSMNVFTIMAFITGTAAFALLAPHATLHTAFSATCDNYDATVTPIVVGVVSSRGGCNNGAVNQGIADMQANLANYLGTSSSAFCTSFQAACGNMQGGCYQSTCPNAAQQTVPVANTVYQQLNAIIQQTQTSQQSIAQLAQFGDTNAQAVVAFVQNIAPAAEYISTTVGPANTNCNWVLQGLKSVRTDLCGSPDGQSDDSQHSLNSRMETIDGLMRGLAFISLVTIVVLIKGIKRFTHLNQYDEARTYNDNVGLVGGNETVVVAIVYGEPSNANANVYAPAPTGYQGCSVQQDYPATGYRTV